jgi:GR25 family glycosyltransferase involved in LPS biosynthesis
MTIPIFCINLKSSTKRKQFIQKEWIDKYGFNINFWQATDKNDPKIENINKKTPYLDRDLLLGEIALIDSYINLLEYIQNHNIKEVIIMEDDIFPNPIFGMIDDINLPNIFFKYIQLCKNEFKNLNMLLMHRICCSNAFNINMEYEYCYQVTNAPWGAQMNYYNSTGIKKFYQNIKNYQFLIDEYSKMKYLWGYIGLLKNPFAFHYETKAKIPHKNFNSDINHK